ncbi:hypothetical protein vBVpaMR16F_243 [Vibrio phage vB_VpaM_R16F]|nr:hypothetical protein vBVpaMR16F_243 [Vibrio phage vB_VpaM_R16F]
MKWVNNEDNYHGSTTRLKLDIWDLRDLISTLNNKSLGDVKDQRLSKPEKLLLQAAINLEDDYRRNENYYERKEWQDRYKIKAEQLESKLAAVTEEKNELEDKIKEAQVQSGLFIKYVKDKLKI